MNDTICPKCQEEMLIDRYMLCDLYPAYLCTGCARAFKNLELSERIFRTLFTAQALVDMSIIHGDELDQILWHYDNLTSAKQETIAYINNWYLDRPNYIRGSNGVKYLLPREGYTDPTDHTDVSPEDPPPVS